MGIVERRLSIGKLYVSNKTYKMALEYKGELISDQQEVLRILCEHRIPINVQFEITQKCNFDCYYCYEKNLRSSKEINLEQVKNILDQLEAMGILFVELTGGEPLVRKEFLEILRYMNQKGFFISIITNGSCLTEEMAKEMANGNVASIRLSLLAGEENVCDKLTNVQGSFQKTIGAAKLLKKYNIPFTLTSVITKENVNLYEEYKQLEEELGIKISYGMNVGTTLTGYDPVKQYELTMEHAKMLEPFIKTNGKVDNNAEYICGAGKCKFAIDNQGNIIPCAKSRSIIGNILEEKFEDIWNSERLKRVLEQELTRNEKCLKCEKRNYCEAFCPALYHCYSSDEERCSAANLIYQLISKGEEE